MLFDPFEKFHNSFVHIIIDDVLVDSALLSPQRTYAISLFFPIIQKRTHPRNFPIFFFQVLIEQGVTPPVSQELNAIYIAYTNCITLIVWLRLKSCFPLKRVDFSWIISFSFHLNFQFFLQNLFISNPKAPIKNPINISRLWEFNWNWNSLPKNLTATVILKQRLHISKMLSQLIKLNESKSINFPSQQPTEWAEEHAKKWATNTLQYNINFKRWHSIQLAHMQIPHRFFCVCFFFFFLFLFWFGVVL